MRRLVPSLVALLFFPVLASADRGDQYISYALQGELHWAGDLFDAADLTEKELELKEKFEARFVRQDEELPSPDASPFVLELIAIYRDMWRQSLMGEMAPEDNEAFLDQQLPALLAKHGEPGASPDDAIMRIESRLEKEGLHLLTGVTRPFHELMIWSRQHLEEYEVELTDRRQDVRVEFIGGFLVTGWAHYATFGVAYTGGWAAKDRLFCLEEDYDRETEKFLVSYLRHEARHFADYGNFPELKQIDLEYRAKLTELAYAVESLPNLLKHFSMAAAENAAAPHAYANYGVLRDLSRELFDEAVIDHSDARWAAVEPSTLHSAAERVLRANTGALRAAGAETTLGVISPPDFPES